MHFALGPRVQTRSSSSENVRRVLTCARGERSHMSSSLANHYALQRDARRVLTTRACQQSSLSLSRGDARVSITLHAGIARFSRRHVDDDSSYFSPHQLAKGLRVAASPFAPFERLEASLGVQTRESLNGRAREGDASPRLYSPRRVLATERVKNTRPPAKLEINSGKVRRIIMHTRYLYYPPTPFCLRALRGAREKKEERKRERGEGRGSAKLCLYGSPVSRVSTIRFFLSVLHVISASLKVGARKEKHVSHGTL